MASKLYVPLICCAIIFLWLGGAHRPLKEVVILSPEEHAQSFVAGPAQFGPDFGINNYVSSCVLVYGKNYSLIVLCTNLSIAPNNLRIKGCPREEISHDL